MEYGKESVSQSPQVLDRTRHRKGLILATYIHMCCPFDALKRYGEGKRQPLLLLRKLGGRHLCER